MKTLTWLLIFHLSALLACSHPNSANGKESAPVNNQVPEEVHTKESSVPSKAPRKTGEFDIDYRGITLKARVDKESNIMILNWPKEWHLKSKLVRYAGKSDTLSFTNDHCRRIRHLAEFPMGKEIIPTAYFSEFVFEVLPFFSDDFKDAVGKALEKFGHPKDDMFILNAIDRPNGQFEIDFSKDAISHVLDLTWKYWDIYNLQFNSTYDEQAEQRLEIRAGDLICDLAQGDAVMHVTFPIDGEKNTIKAIYDPTELMINQ